MPQNLVPSSALQRQLKKKQKQEEEDMEQEQERMDASTSTHDVKDKMRGEPGGKKAKAAQQPSDDIPIRDMIPYLVFHRDVTDEEFQWLMHQLKLWGVPCFAYPRRDHLRHLETRGEKGHYVGPGSRPSMDSIYLREGNSGADKLFRHVLVPPALHSSMQCAFICFTGKTNAMLTRFVNVLMLRNLMNSCVFMTVMSLSSSRILMSPSWRSFGI